MFDRRKFWRAAGAGVLALVSAATLAWGTGAGRTAYDALTGKTPKKLPGRKPPRKSAGVFAKAPDVMYVPTPQATIDQMLELAEVRPDDVLYDLGCGDGRILVTAAKRYGIKGVGFEIDPSLVAEARENAVRHGVSHLVTIRQDDLFAADLSEATVVSLFLLPQLNVRLMPKLARLKPGSRIVSYAFNMRGAKPKVVEKAREESLPGSHEVFLWVVPWEEESEE